MFLSSSSAERKLLMMNPTSASFSISAMSALQSVVLPVPTSPLTRMNPLRSRMP